MPHIELSARQMDIVKYVRKREPVTSEQIAEYLGLSRPTIRSDLALLVMLRYLDAKPKVGYFTGNVIAADQHVSRKLLELKVKDVQSMPVIVRETTSVSDAVVTLFLENVGSLIVADREGNLLGIISRKDLIKVTLGNPAAAQMPVSFVMTRKPNLIFVSPEDSVLDAGRKMIHHQIDSLPVIVSTIDERGHDKQEVVGRVTKTTMTELLIRLATEPPE